MINLVLNANGEEYETAVAPYHTPRDVLREKLGFTDVKKGGGGGGECGVCTVLVNGKAVNSCLMLAVKANDSKITTVRGLFADGKLHPCQEKFTEHRTIQCSYCTPGMILTAKALLDKNPNPSEEEGRAAIY